MHEALRARVERAAHARAPPLSQVPARVELPTLVIETVRDLVPDDDPDPAVVEIPAIRGRCQQGRAGQGRAGQGRAGQGRAGQGRAGQMVTNTKGGTEG